MVFHIKPLLAAHKKQIQGWRYAAPYAIYDGKEELASESMGIFSEADELCGYFCWGDDAQVKDARALYTAEPDALDFGIGLAPEYTGHGLGLFAVEHALSWLRGALHPRAFRLAVYGWNRRAIAVYRRAGFILRAPYGDFWLMERDERPWREASRPLVPGMRVYPDDPPFERVLYYLKENSGFDMSAISMTVHAGTHIDAPAHIGLTGDTRDISLDSLNETAQLLDFLDIEWGKIRSPYLLLKNCDGLSLEQAKCLCDKGIRLVGVDGLSVGISGVELPVHRLLLEKGVILLENAALSSFAEGFYEMRCLPLLMPDSDGAPVRLLLREVRA